MANIQYLTWLKKMADKQLGWEASTTYRAMLERTGSTYVPDIAHDFVSDLTGFLEVTDTGSSRQTITNKTTTKNSIAGRIDWACNPITFPNTGNTQAAKGLLIYAQIGGNDLTPADDVLAMYFDTDIGNLFPLQFSGNSIVVPVTRLLSQLPQL